MRFLTWVAVALLALAHLASSAQSDVILRDKDVNESALIEALTPLPSSAPGRSACRRTAATGERPSSGRRRPC